MLTDTHCHLNMMIRDYKTKEKFIPLSETEIEACKKIINHAAENEVTKIINVGTDLIESLTCIDIAKHFESNFATIGLHPNDANNDWKKTIVEFKHLLADKQELKIVGIGECGIDKHYPGYDLKRQKEAFEAQIELALEYNLPLSIHSRDADEETYQGLASYKNEPNLKGVIHCFSSDENYAQKYLDLGFVLGVGGTLTYPKNDTLRNVAKMVTLKNIILETDAPFLAPQKFRGQQNSPAHIQTIAQFVAELLDISYKKVTETTEETVHNLFNI